MTKLQQTEGAKEGELEGFKCWWAERRRLSSSTHPSSQAPQHLLLVFFLFVFFKPGKRKGLRNVLERHSVDFALSKAWSLCFLSGTLTDTGCPSAPGYVYPEVEQAQQALHRLHL